MEIRDFEMNSVMNAINKLTSKVNQVRVLCVGMLGQLHMPKTGELKIEVEVEGGSVVSGKVYTEHRAYEIKGFSSGLNSSCLVVRLDHCSLYLDLPVKEQVDFRNAFAVVVNPKRSGDSQIEDICHWLDRTAK